MQWCLLKCVSVHGAVAVEETDVSYVSCPSVSGAAPLLVFVPHQCPMTVLAMPACPCDTLTPRPPPHLSPSASIPGYEWLCAAFHQNSSQEGHFRLVNLPSSEGAGALYESEGPLHKRDNDGNLASRCLFIQCMIKGFVFLFPLDRDKLYAMLS